MLTAVSLSTPCPLPLMSATRVFKRPRGLDASSRKTAAAAAAGTSASSAAFSVSLAVMPIVSDMHANVLPVVIVASTAAGPVRTSMKGARPRMDCLKGKQRPSLAQLMDFDHAAAASTLVHISSSSNNNSINNSNNNSVTSNHINTAMSQFAVTDSPPVRTSNAQSSERERGEGGSEVVEREREREAPVSRRKPCARNRPRLYSLHSSDRPSQASLLLDNDKDDLGPSICV
ncbi:hypothetical protein BJ741DRAFT_703058 [Chytriomyces cf. hyalinus JEL632]|nr:hypothetical protein BJ741DRAFT_703058 [Chytriomyces cf. hyalinus JEL632]